MKLLVLPGDGIGPEITRPTVDVLKIADDVYGLGLEFEFADIGFASLENEKTTLPSAVLERIPQVDGVILGPVSHYSYPPREQGGINPSAALRTQFGLFANIRPSTSREGLGILRSPMDLVIVRENTEGFYSDRNMFAGSGEFMPDADSAFSIRKITAEGSARVAYTAFELARRRRRRVTAVHKANVLKLTDGLFLREVRAASVHFPDVELDELIVDAAAARLIRTPEQFDVIVTTNMFGDILSDEAAELSGSLGLGGSLNQGSDMAVAQAQHGSAPDIAGAGIANPTSLILSSAMMLDWHARRVEAEPFASAAAGIEHAVEQVLADPDTRTRDLGGRLSTTEFAALIIEHLAALRPTAAHV
jgi:isocitrate/isopropylmalate dehydrogenase